MDRGTEMAMRRVLGVACLVALVCGCGPGGSDSPRSEKPRNAASASSGVGRAVVTFAAGEPASADALERAAELMRDRAEEAGLGAVEVTVEEKSQVTVTGPADRQEALEALGQPAELGFRPVLSQVPKEGGGECPAAVDAAPAEPLTACGKDQTTVYTYELEPVAVSGTDVSDADAAFDEERGIGWFVKLDFTSAGSKKFADVTGRLARQTPPNNQFAIVLDGAVLSAPSVNSAITGGEAEISGSFTKDSAEELAAQLATGALPVRLTVSSVTKLR